MLIAEVFNYIIFAIKMHACFLYLLDSRCIIASFYKRCNSSWIVILNYNHNSWIISTIIFIKIIAVLFIYVIRRVHIFKLFFFKLQCLTIFILFNCWKVPIWNFILIRLMTSHLSTQLVPIPTSVGNFSMLSNPWFPLTLSHVSEPTSSHLPMSSLWLSPHTVLSFPWTPWILF